jgi:FAD/FMN-containing dehydrogenase
LREELKSAGSAAEVLTPDSVGYTESLKRWSEHNMKRAVSMWSRPAFNALLSKSKHVHLGCGFFLARQFPEEWIRLTEWQHAVVLVKSAYDVSKTLEFIKANKTPFVVRGGGHSTSGSSSIDDGLVIDLSKMRKVTVDPEAKTIKAEGGTIWEDVDVEAAKFGLATVGGTVNHTGVGGK